MTTRLAVAFGNLVGRTGLLLIAAVDRAEGYATVIRGKVRNR